MRLRHRINIFLCILAALFSTHGLAANPPPNRPDLGALPPGLLPVVARDLARELPDAWHARRDGEHVQMHNVAHRYVMRFDENGSQLKTDDGHRFGMRLTAYGRGEKLTPTQPGRINIDKARVDIARENLREWYINSQLGVEQGFTLDSAPQGSATSAVILRFAIESDLSAKLIGDEIALKDADDKTLLRYEKLRAFDANGRVLPASMALDGNTLALNVQDRDAVYPITIDPIFTSSARLSSFDSVPGENFGWSVAVHGDTVVVGAPLHKNNAGAAYIYVKPANGWSDTSTFTAKLMTSLSPDWFGTSVAVWDDIIVVGAPTRVEGNQTNSGAAYLFVKPSTGWVSTGRFRTKLICRPDQQDRWYGANVAIWKDTVVVSAYQQHSPGTMDYAGAVCLFEKPSTGWGTTTAFPKVIRQKDPTPGNAFGWNTVLIDDTLVVGAFGYQPAPGLYSGAGYVYLRPSTGWTNTTQHQAKLTINSPTQTDYLGTDVAMSDTTQDIFLGAPSRSRPNCLYCGSVFVFSKPSTGWQTTNVPTAEITAPDAGQNDQFGLRLAAHGDFLAVGAPNHDNKGVTDTGAIYTFQRPTGGWVSTSSYLQKFVPADNTVSDFFGADMAASVQGTFVVGSCRLTNQYCLGAAYVLKP